MKPRHQVSRAAIELIKRFEGYRREAVQLPDGRWTIGYGHTQFARQGAAVSEADAEALLVYDLIAVAHAVNETTYVPLAQNQFDALVAFAFNIGIENFKSSAVLRRLNEGEFLQAGLAMELWRKADFGNDRIVVDALVRRRAAEKALFLTPERGEWVPAPTPVLPPNLDMDSTGLVPRETPAPLTARVEGDQIVLRRDGALEAEPGLPEAERGQGPAKAAAAAVASRLKAIVSAAEAGPEPARPLTQPQADFAPPQPASLAAVAGERPFALTPPEEEPEPEPAPRPARLELIAANEGAPGLFDRAGTAANDQPVEAPNEAPRAPPVTARAMDQELGRLLGVGGAGLALFAASLVWTLDAPDGAAGSRVVLGWLVGLAGIGLLSLSAYRLFDRLGRAAEGEGAGR